MRFAHLRHMLDRSSRAGAFVGTSRRHLRRHLRRLARRHARRLGHVALLAGAVVVAPVAALRAQPTRPATAAVADLPLVEVAPRRAGGSTLAVFLSGDGGWAELDRQVAEVLAEHGVGVVGLNSRAYLSQRRTPEQVAADVARIVRAYAVPWGAQRLALIGYSRGADMVPFVATRLPEDLRQRTALLVMLGLEHAANLHFHWVDVLSDVRRRDDLPVAPELARLRGQRMLCVYGVQERDSGCRDADSTLITRVARQGDHHFDGDYRALGDLILGFLAPPR